MPLTLYDTMAREKRAFKPADPGRVTMYVCGPTVYGYAHIGNARPAVVFDVLFRLLKRAYGEDAVLYARNVTDVDDKINAKAAKEDVPIADVAERYAKVYNEDIAALGVLSPTIEPRATRHMDAIVDMIARLIKAGCAYEAEGHVLFNVPSYSDYGKFSRRDRDEMIAGARVEVAPYKRDPADFVLWKPSKGKEPRWDSPWGPGRPGWHVECSAMIEKTLGETIDIHGGGLDLVFPHHENEIAQSVCAHHGAPYVRYWVHNGMLEMDQEKMAKSVGNVALIHDLLRDWPGEVLRHALLTAHYRQPLAWSDDLLKQSKRQLDRFYRLLGEIPFSAETGEAPQSVVLALEDDLNTPEAYAGLHELRDVASQLDGDARQKAIARLRDAGRLMGFLGADPAEWFRGDAGGGPSAEDIENRLAERAEARKAKDFAKADRIRDELEAQGIVIEDGAGGATWRRA